MVRVVVELGFGAAPGTHVLGLHDEVVRGELPITRERDVERHPHVGAVAMQAANFGVNGGDVALHELVDQALQGGNVVVVHQLGKLGRQQLHGIAPEHFAERLVGLDEPAFGRHQRHADGGVREGAVEAALAFLQLLDVALIHLLALEVVVQRRKEHRDEGCGHQQRRQPEMLEAHEEHAGDRGAGEVGEADPAGLPDPAPRAQRLLALQRDERRGEHRVGDEVGRGKDEHQPEDHAAVQAGRDRLLARDLEHRSARKHCNRSHRRGDDAARPAFGDSPCRHRALRSGGNHRGRDAVHQQHEEDEDLAARDRRFRPGDAHREKAHDRGDRGAEEHLQEQFPLELADLGDGVDQRPHAEENDGPPVALRRRRVVLHVDERHRGLMCVDWVFVRVHGFTHRASSGWRRLRFPWPSWHRCWRP